LREGKTEEYMKLLVDNFNPAAADGVMVGCDYLPVEYPYMPCLTAVCVDLTPAR